MDDIKNKLSPEPSQSKSSLMLRSRNNHEFDNPNLLKNYGSHQTLGVRNTSLNDIYGSPLRPRNEDRLKSLIAELRIDQKKMQRNET